MTEEPRVEEVNCRSMEAFAASQKSFKQGFVRVNGYIMPRRYLQDRPPESTVDHGGRIYKEENPGSTPPCSMLYPNKCLDEFNACQSAGRM
jgi:hypothetical protein